MLEFCKPFSWCRRQTGLFSQFPKSNKTGWFYSKILHKLCSRACTVHRGNAPLYINELLNTADLIPHFSVMISSPNQYHDCKLKLARALMYMLNVALGRHCHKKLKAVFSLASSERYLKLESVQLRKHCISKAERHRARRSEFFGFVWFENIVFGRFAKCACQPPSGFAWT